MASTRKKGEGTFADRLRSWYAALFGKSAEKLQLDEQGKKLEEEGRRIQQGLAEDIEDYLLSLRRDTAEDLEDYLLDQQITAFYWRERSLQIPLIVHSSPVPPLLESGKVIKGRYDSYMVQDCISQTWLSRVYKAKSQGLGIDMVVKQYLKDESVHDFSRESFGHNRLYYSSGHRNIIPAYEFLVTEDDDRLGVFPYIEGETLDKIAAREGQFSLKQVLPLVLPVCDALEHTHNLGIVHRDVKPHNIIISASAEVTKDLLESYPDAVRPMLFDFGLSWHDDISGFDRLDSIYGTLSHMAPEGFDLGRTPNRARDNYALGVVLYRLLAGRFPFNGRTDYDLVQAHRYAPVPDITQFNSTVTADVKYIVDKTLAKDPEQRYHTMAALKQDLEALQ